MNKRDSTQLALLLLLFSLFVGCATIEKETAATLNMKPAIKIKNIQSLTADSRQILAKHAAAEEIYFIVHPSYFLFFHEDSFIASRDGSLSVVQIFIDSVRPQSPPIIQLMKEYERTQMEFISSSKSKKRIIILILPGGYLNSKQYIYREGTDEYARYLNQIALDSDTLFYLESVNSTSGKLASDDQRVLQNFLKDIGAARISVGGGYVGRCQEEFYKYLLEIWPEDKLAIVPELSAFSPNDISDSTAKMLLTSEKKLNPWAAKYFLKNGGLKNLSSKVNIRSLSADEPSN